MNIIKNLLSNRNIIMPLGIVTGLILGPGISFLKPYTIYIIGAILAISMSNFDFKMFKPDRENIKYSLKAVIFNYIVFNILLLVPAYFFAPHNIFIGFVVIAATPPAIAIIPFTINLEGDAKQSIVGVFSANILAVLITPALLILFLGQSSIQPGQILLMMLELLLIPIIVSRFLRMGKLGKFINRNRPHMVDWGFFLVAATVIGMSRNILFSKVELLLIPAAILISLQFVLNPLIFAFMQRFGISRRRALSSSMLMFVKNAGFSAVLAISLFPEVPEIFIPSAVMSVLLPVYYVFMNTVNAHHIQNPRPINFRLSWLPIKTK